MVGVCGRHFLANLGERSRAPEWASHPCPMALSPPCVGNRRGGGKAGKGKFVLGEKDLQHCGMKSGGERNQGEAEKQEMRAKEQIQARKSRVLHLCGTVAFSEHFLRPGVRCY